MEYYKTNELYHHGILGMKWGIRRYQPYPDGKKGRFVGEKRHKEVTGNISNVDKWGNDEKHNTLYISGVSGSGKSTLAKRLSDGNAEVIHLDKYLEFQSDETGSETQNKSFNDWLSKTVPDFKKLTQKDGFTNLKDRWKVIDALGEQIENFSRQSYKSGKKVIVEGLQLSDDTIFPDKSYFKDKPVVILTTKTSDALKRAIVRDLKRDTSSVEGFINKIETALYSIKGTVLSLDERKEWYDFFNTKLEELSNEVSAKNGKEWLNKNFN